MRIFRNAGWRRLLFVLAIAWAAFCVHDQYRGAMSRYRNTKVEFADRAMFACRGLNDPRELIAHEQAVREGSKLLASLFRPDDPEQVKKCIEQQGEWASSNKSGVYVSGIAYGFGPVAGWIVGGWLALLVLASLFDWVLRGFVRGRCETGK